MQEKRRHFRKRIDLAVEFSVSGSEQTAGICRDLSLGGMQIDVASTAPFGANVMIRLSTGAPQGTLTLPAIVRWVQPGSMGVQFGLLGARETYALTELLSKS